MTKYWKSVMLMGILVSFAVELTAQQMVLPANTPQGEAKGIYPGRVAWGYAPGTATWEGEGYWFDDQYNKQENCDWLVSNTLQTLTATQSDSAAWSALFVYFNTQKGKETTSYLSSEKIAIKVNMNNTYTHDESEELNASPQLILALLKSLVLEAKVPQNQITVFDASRQLTDYSYNKLAAEFPDVIYVDNTGGNGRTKSTYIDNLIPYSEDNGHLAQGLATCLVEADYLINMALLKGHMGQGVTLCAKNWYGVTNIHSDWRHNHHDNFNQNRDGSPKYMTFVDFMGHKDIGAKTLVYFIDALYGSENVAGAPSGKWEMSPFNGNWPNSLFASQDPVAIDAVGVDFLSTEFPKAADMDYADAYLVEAALADNPPSGTVYDPERDGIPLKSLGVVEHWNNPEDKQYSRNLGKEEGIELVQVK